MAAPRGAANSKISTVRSRREGGLLRQQCRGWRGLWGFCLTPPDARSRILSLLNTPPSSVAVRNSPSQSTLNFFTIGRSIRLSCEQRFTRGPRGRGHLRGLTPIHFVDVHSALAAFDVQEHQQVAVPLVPGHFIGLVRLQDQNRKPFDGLPFAGSRRTDFEGRDRDVRLLRRSCARGNRGLLDRQLHRVRRGRYVIRAWSCV